MKISVLFIIAFVASSYTLSHHGQKDDATIGDNQIINTKAEETNNNAGTNASLADAKNSTRDGGSSKCECAVFNTSQPTEGDTPIIAQAPLNLPCKAGDEEKCIKLCTALAMAAKDQASKLLCNVVGHYRDLKVSLHSRICGAANWTHTGVTSTESICCHDFKVIDCKKLDEIQPNDEV